MKNIKIPFLFFAFTLFLIACSSDQTEQSDIVSSETVMSGPRLIVAHDVNFPPFEFLNDNLYTGFDLDLLDALAKECNFNYEAKSMDFNGIIPALQAKQIDMAVAAMTIKPERAEVVNFSIPYFRTGLVLVVKADNSDIEKPEDLIGKTIAVRIGTSGESYIRALPYAEQIKIVTYDTVSDAYLSVSTGIADAAINDESNIRYYINTVGEGKLKVTGGLLTGDDYGIAIPKGDDKLLMIINNGLLELVKDGTYDALYKKWFGTEPAYHPGD